MPVEFLYRVPRWVAFGVVLVVGAVLFAAPQVMDLVRESGWRTTEGQVAAAREVTATCGRSECTRLQVEYRYTAGAQSYSGQAELSARPNAYPAGAAVPVRYDAADPSQSTLDATAPSQRALGLGLAAVAAVGGMLCLWKGLR